MVLALLLLSFFSVIQAQDEYVPYVPVNQQIWEEDLMEGLWLGDKQWAYYEMTISDFYFNGSQSLAIKVLPESYGSDPDIFISKNNTKPTSSADSQWYCVKKGGDTCVIKNNEIAIGNVLFIGVRCINPCNYTLNSNYFMAFIIPEDTSTQVRLEGYSSYLFQYTVPTDASDGFARAITFTLESEDEYNPIDLYFSLDDTIYQNEERKIENIMSNGVGFYFTENDNGWCTACKIYFFAEVLNGGRYYAKGVSTSRNPLITNVGSFDKMVNIRQQDCYQYYANNQNNDIIITAQQYQGDIELYVAGTFQPTNPAGPTGTGIILVSERGFKRSLILSALDRVRQNRATGVYNLCIFGNDDSSVNIAISEENNAQRYDVSDRQVYTFNIERRNYIYFRYTSPDLTQAANITVRVQTYGLNLTNSSSLPGRVFYKICQNSDPTYCLLSANEGNGTARTMLQLNNSTVNGSIRTGIINHNPKSCSNPSSCYYLITVFNPESIVMKTSFQIPEVFREADNAIMTKAYRNIIQQGRYFYYKLDQGNSPGSQFLNALTINLQNYIGDAELYISTSNPYPTDENFEYASRQYGVFESIRMEKSENYTLNRTINIGVYAQTFSVYYLDFIPEYSYSYQALLSRATPLTEGVPVYNYFVTERNESFYYFLPWWTGFENRTIIFFADVIFNNIFFYMEINDFPNFYRTEWQDKNDTIAIYPNDAGYSRTNGYFVRARPDFALYDLISQRQYIFNFYAISQLPNTMHIDLHHNESVFGYANASTVYYRHYLLERNATYNLTVIPIIGNPAVYIKVDNIVNFPRSSNIDSYDIKLDKSGKAVENQLIDEDFRGNYEIMCDTEAAGYYMWGGSTNCTIYIGVECTSYCVYKIQLDNLERMNRSNPVNVNLTVPLYLTTDMYYTGHTQYRTYKYFYIPIAKDFGDMVIYLNKTTYALDPNGDSMVLISFNNDTQFKKLENWTFPNMSIYNTISMNQQPNAPEIIELCPRIVNDRCGNISCVLTIGVLGLTNSLQSNFRMIYQSGKNKLYDKNVINGTTANAGTYQYYWFVANQSVQNASAYWSYTIAASVGGSNQDIDLYVTVLDGRYPITEDYDYKADNLGPDVITVTSNDDIWRRNNYNKSVGVLFMVGVKALTNNVSYSLVMLGPELQATPFTALVTGTQYLRNLSTGNFTQYFRWFNWGFRDFRINIDVSQGQVFSYLNFITENTFINNGYLAVPRNQNNSKWSTFLNVTQSTVLRVFKDDFSNANGLFCYYCMYYIMITTNLTNATTQYRISVNYVPDVGEEVAILNTNQNYTVTLPATGTVTQRKFILDSKDNFFINAIVTTGLANIYVGLYPNNAQSKFSWSASASAGKTAKIAVKQTDSSFYIGAFYYITLQAANGRTSVNLYIQQRKNVIQLQNRVTYKQIYWNIEERVKLYYFQIPNRAFSRVTLNITALTDNFYPMILLYKNGFGSSISDPSSQLQYPNHALNNFTFGDNFTEVANRSHFIYSFRDWGNQTFTFYTLALYAWSYGLTDQRKAEFQISLTLDTLNLTATETDMHPQSSVKSYFDPVQTLKNPYDQSQFELFTEWTRNKYNQISQSFEELFLS